MFFADNGPDIPISLLRAQRSGNLLFVVGAGISKAAGLPLFGELADQVYARLGQGLPGNPGSLANRAEIEARLNGQYDRLIGLLEQRLVLRRPDWHQPHNSVREAVTALVSPPPRANITAHADLLDLSRAIDGRPRLVTTNFDTLFERAWRRRTGHDVLSSAGPGMPAVGSHEFSGVLHIHGRVADPHYRLPATDLVLTSANFGEAYMRNGWASRFVYDLLRRYTLLLIGYSADDPPMRYMLEATEEGRLNFPDLKPAFALVGDTANDAGTLREAWRGKGVQPLVYAAPGHDHSALYETLGAWAGLARDPLQWSAQRLAQLSAVTKEEATADARTTFAFLAREVSSVSVASQSATDAAWVEEILPVDPMDTGTFVAWFRHRLDLPAAARYAVAAGDGIKPHIALAVDILLRALPNPLPPLYQRFWLLYCQANLASSPSPYGRIRSDAGITSSRVNELVARLAPRLRIERHFRWSDTDTPPDNPANIHDLGHFTFQAPDRDWHRQLERWPEETQAEERLLQALDRALSERLELGLDAGLIEADGDLRSYDLALVHAPESDEGLVDANDRHTGSWRLNQPDANNQRFAPLIRMMTAIWRRLAARAPERAGQVARIWAERDAIIFKRLAAWTAIEGDAPSSLAIERYLRSTDRARYWTTDHRPELVRFYCRRWNDLAPQTRHAIERAILAGIVPAVIQRIADPGDRNYARALYTSRELARIRSAGGTLSRNALARLNALYRKFPNLPRDMPIYAHLYSPSWSGSGYSADVRVLDQVSDARLIESAGAFEENNRIEQADLWTAFAKVEPARAFAALSGALAKGTFEGFRWSPFLGIYAYPEPDLDEAERPPLAEVLQTILRAPTAGLGSVSHQLARIVEVNADGPDHPLYPPIMALWDKLIDVTAAPEQDEPDHPLSELVFSHPLGVLAVTLVNILDAMHPPAGQGLPGELVDRFDRLADLAGRAGLIARGSLMQQLPYLRAIAPQWVDERLMPGLLGEDDDAIDLMSVVARWVGPQDPVLFNLLKPAIIHTLEHDRTEDGIRELLSGALVGAAFAKIGGRAGYELTDVECRQTLTRVTSSVLSSMAWELMSLLRDRPDAVARGDYWNAAMAPFFRDYWPNDVSARTPGVSENLAHLPALAGTAFEHAVDIVLDMVCPIQRYDLQYGLGLSDEADFLGQYPRAALKLISGILDRAATPPGDLSEVIDRLLQVDPQIATEPAFWRLRQMLRED